MRVALGADHAGFPHKDILAHYLQDQGVEVVDFGPENGTDSVDYPDFAKLVGEVVAQGSAEFGILVCGTGIGMAIAANKITGVRAANIVTPEFAALARQHNDANVLTLSARFVDTETNKAIVDAFLKTPYDGGRHQHRVDKISSLEN